MKFHDPLSVIASALFAGNMKIISLVFCTLVSAHNPNESGEKGNLRLLSIMTNGPRASNKLENPYKDSIDHILECPS